MRMRTVTLANVILALALVSLIGYMAGRQNAEAQRPPVRGATSLQVAVVDLSMLFEQANDIKGLQECVTLHQELFRLRQENGVADLQKLKDDLEAAEEGSGEWERMMADYNSLAAYVETLSSVHEYEQRLDFAKFSRAIFEKLLAVVEQEAKGNYHLVLKTYRASAEELDTLEREAVAGDMNRQLNFYRARTLLFADTEAQAANGSKILPDVTPRILETINSRGSEDMTLNGRAVSHDIRARLAELKKEIDKLKGQG